MCYIAIYIYCVCTLFGFVVFYSILVQACIQWCCRLRPSSWSCRIVWAGFVAVTRWGMAWEIAMYLVRISELQSCWMNRCLWKWVCGERSAIQQSKTWRHEMKVSSLDNGLKGLFEEIRVWWLTGSSWKMWHITIARSLKNVQTVRCDLDFKIH